MIFVFSASIIFPTICGACKFEDPHEYMDSERDEIGPMLAWFMVGLFLVMGYSIPLELLRKSAFALEGVLMSMGGGTIILCAIVLFVRIIYY